MSATMQRRPGQTMQQGSMLTPQMASAARNLASLGTGRDSILAHINPREAQMLMRMGGSGSINPRTGLRQFDDSVPQITIPSGGTAPPGFTPSNVPYTDLGGAQADNPFDTALYSSYGGSGPLPAGVAPIDPTLLNFVDQNIQSLASGAGGGAQDPFLMADAPGASPELTQFLATPGNPNFTIDPSGYADFTPAGEAAYNAYAGQQEQSIAANAANNQRGDMEGVLAALALPTAVVGAGFGAEALGAFGAADAGLGDALFGPATADAASAAAPSLSLGDALFGPADAAGTAATTAGTTTAATDLGLGDALFGPADAAGTATGTTATATASDLGLGDALFGPATANAAVADPGLGDALFGPATADVAAAPDATFATFGPAADNSLFLGGTETADATTGGQLVPDAFSADAGTAGGGLTAGTTTTGGFDAGGLASQGVEQVPGFSATATGTAGATTGSGGFGGWLSSMGDKFVSGLSDPFKLLGLGAAGFGLFNALNSAKGPVGNVTGNENQLQALANQTGAQGAQYSSYLASGTLPPGLQAEVTNATQAAIAQTKAKYAANGLGPNSTMEQQDINSINNQALALQGQLGQQLLQSGIALTGLDEKTLQALLTTNTSFANQTNQAIANLARALSGGGLTTTNTNAQPAAAA
jgi:hypothetical protein